MVVIKKSKIIGKGVFATKNFKKGDVVLVWKPKLLKEKEIRLLSKKEKTYLLQIGKDIFLQQPPERFVNRSCNPNTKPKNNCDIAIRNIKKGEEITSDYDLDKGEDCSCGDINCKNK